MAKCSIISALVVVVYTIKELNVKYALETSGTQDN